ncbi:PilW family protein [Ideonella sp. BN130291]|uniref:PilW family protein n=1 Tax=Ideonella sp. BN130291 TaxID=3112940 RepID=UPI002E26FC6F|nr:PilW family protein [Ideonella sp. BN130291]
MFVASSRGRRVTGGFTLIELMVGIVIGLLTTAVIAQVLYVAEGFRRSASSGSDAQVTGALGLYAIERELRVAGYGLASAADVLGCTLKAKYAGADMNLLPATLTPVTITVGAGEAPDTIRMIGFQTRTDAAGGRGATFSMPTALLPPYYDPADQSAGGKAFRFPVTSVVGFAANDLAVAAVPKATSECQLFQVTSLAAGGLMRDDDAKWNPNGWPTVKYGSNAMVVNLGAIRDIRFGVQDGKLQSRIVDTGLTTGAAPALGDWQDLQANIVNMKALFGKDTKTAAALVPPTRTVDTYTSDAPTAAEWQERRVIAVRVAVLVRSGQYEKEEVVGDDDPAFYWNIGSGVTVPAGAVDCPTGGGKCIKLKHDFSTDWKHYRYKMFETVVPLRNMVWFS